MNVYNPKDCTFIEKQYVERMSVENMSVQEQVVGGEPKREDGFDIEAFPQSHFKFLRGLSLKEQKREVMVMREELKEEAAKYEDITHRKGDLLMAVFGPRIPTDKVKDIPGWKVMNDLFGDCIDGIAKAAVAKFKGDVERKYHVKFHRSVPKKP